MVASPKCALPVFVFNKVTDVQNPAHNPSASKSSPTFGEKINRKPCPFTSAEKLDTQNGIRKSRNTCQRSSFVLPFADDVMLITSAIPMIALSPSDVNQMRGFASK